MKLLQIHPDFVEKLKASVNTLLPQLSADLETYDGQDYSIYTGTCGIALLYLLVSSKHKTPDYVTVSASHLIEYLL